MRKAAALFVATLLASAAPLAAFTLVERGATFSTHVTLQQAALCDGSVKLAPGTYKLDVASMGDGSVRASFFDSTGRKAGEARGIIAVLKGGTSAPAGAAPAGAANSTQKIQPAGELKIQGQATEAMSLNFTKLGFSENSRKAFRTEGQSLKLEVFSTDGGHSILIGLLLPAVQKAREAAAPPSAQKIQK
jgi:hypothetical protein